jgi:hypothetical protein
MASKDPSFQSVAILSNAESRTMSKIGFRQLPGERRIPLKKREISAQNTARQINYSSQIKGFA